MSLFLIAILPPEKVDEQVRQWKNFMLEKFGCRVALKSPAHITLIPPLQLSDNRQQELHSFLHDFAFQNHPFEVQLQDFSAFPPSVIFVRVLENARLLHLKSKLEAGMIAAQFPVKKENRPFHPHVTIANRDLQKPDFPVAWTVFKSMQYQADFRATSITLLKHNGRIWDRVYDATLPENRPVA